MAKTVHQMNMEVVGIVARNVRKYRKIKGLSQETLAQLVDVEFTTISRIENSKVNTTVTTLFNIAKALEIPVHKLLMD